MKKFFLPLLTFGIFSVQVFSQNVGIGTNTPGYKLDVVGDVNVSTGSGYLVNGNAGSGQYLRGDGTRFAPNTIQAGDLPNGTGNTWQRVSTNVTLLNAGDNVGIGVSSPSVSLEIAQNKAFKLGDAYLSSGSTGGTLFADYGTNGWFNGSAWTIPTSTKKTGMMQFADESFNIYQTQTNGATDFVNRFTVATGGSVGINNATPDASAILDIASSTKGLLPPRMSTRPTSPAAGLIIYNTNNGCLEFYSNSAWQSIACPCSGVPTTPGVITGTNTNLCIADVKTYTILPVAGATLYNWTAPTGSSINGGGNTLQTSSTSISVTIGSTAGNLTVTAQNSCGTSVSAATLALSFVVAPATPTFTVPASSPLVICPSSTGNTFTITPLGTATSYTWTVTGTGAVLKVGGVTQTSPYTGTATSVTVDWGTTTGSVAAKATSCGGLSSSNGTITVNFPVAPNVPAISPTSVANQCPGTGAGNFTVTPSGTGVTTLNYTWSAPSGSSIYVAGVLQSNPVTTTATTVSVTMGGTVANVSVTANACGGAASSAAQSTITAPAAPNTPAISPTSNTICPSTGAGTFTVTPSGSGVATSTYTWSAPSGSTIYIGGSPTTNPVTTTSTSVSVTFGATAGNVSVTANNCAGTASSASSAAVSFYSTSLPAITGPTKVIANATGITYSFASAIPGATAYSWSVSGGGAAVSGSSTGSTVNINWTGGSVGLSAAATTVSCTVTICGTGYSTSLGSIVSGGKAPFQCINGVTTGDQTWNSGGITSIRIRLWGAGGAGGGSSGPGSGGSGGYVDGTWSGVAANTAYTVVAGMGGYRNANTTMYGGGGPSNTSGTASCGGGRSALSLSGTDIIVAGGGGGASYSTTSTYGGAGGGDGTTGHLQNGQGGGGAGGGTATAGGTVGSGGTGQTAGGVGSQWLGGKGSTSASYYGGGGGGGWYGGGGGGTNGGGGGGSSHVPSSNWSTVSIIPGNNNTSGGTAAVATGSNTVLVNSVNDYVSNTAGVPNATVGVGGGGSGTDGGAGLVVIYW